MYDIIFITYNDLEPDATNQYIEYLKLFPTRRVNRIQNIKGIHQAHIEAAKRASTSMFYVIDADAELLPNFKFDLELDPTEEDIVHVWRSINPINGLEYGYGGVKLLPRQLTIDMDISSIDMTTGISKRFKIIDQPSNITRFNTDALSTWRSSFRECVKLSSSIIPGQLAHETIERLNVWRYNNSQAPFAEYSRGGASAGEWYGTTYKDDPIALAKINDFEWLTHQFNAHIEQFPPETFKVNL
jgi:hypothetical protein